MNRRHRAAQLAGRASVQLHTLIFFSGDGAKEEDGFVLDVDTADKSEPTFRVMIPRYGIEGQVRIPVDSDDPKLERSPDQYMISYQNADEKVSIQVFDKVRVSLWVKNSQDYQRELIIELVSPQFGPLHKKRSNASEREDPLKSSVKNAKRRAPGKSK